MLVRSLLILPLWLIIPVIVSAVAPPRPLREQGLLPGDVPDGVNRRASVERADTSWFGDYQVIGGEYHARTGPTKSSVMWTFDRGNGPTNDPNRIYNGEGWMAVDLTQNRATYFRVVDASLDLGAGVPPPIIAGAKSLWIGADEPQALDLCWVGGAGYGNNWCQRVVSEALPYDGTGSVTLSLKYFNDSEPCYDGTQVYLKRADGTELMLNPYPPGTCADGPLFDGGFTSAIGSYSNPAVYNRAITQEEIGSAQEIRFVIEFASDGGYSDEDGDFLTTWGPFGADDVAINGGGIDVNYDFENGLAPWTATVCDGVGDFVDIADVGCYTILDPCACRLAGNILEMHRGLCDSGIHPEGQHVWIESPICDVAGDIAPKRIFMDFDLYGEMPQENGVMLRPRWRYYPWVCPLTGATGWSPRIGQDAYYYLGSDPSCRTWRFGGTEITTGEPVPPTAQRVVVGMEMMASCAAFAITNCSGITNATPLFDNFAVGTTPFIHAPAVNFDVGTRFRDTGSFPSNLFDPRAPGPANVSLDKYMDTPDKPDLAGDTLVVAGPQPGSDPNKRWEARLWWRVARRAPLQSDRANGAETKYKTWRDRVADGKQIDRPYRPEFTFGWMDSVQNGTIPLRNQFLSSFRENDDDFVGEGNPENEMIWDDVLFPGTRVEYFITSNYIGTPNALYYLPDTSGGFLYEFEVLPGVRTANIPGCGGGGFNYCIYHPATLYIDAFGRGAQFYIENGLRTILNGLPPCTELDGCNIPFDANWDRFDYDDACS